MTQSVSTDPMEELSIGLRRLKDEHEPKVSYRRIEYAVSEILGEVGPTQETIRQYHDGNVGLGRVNLAWVAAICRFYGKTISDVSPELGKRAAARAALLSGLVTGGKHTRASQLRDEVVTCATASQGNGVVGAKREQGGTRWTTHESSHGTRRSNANEDSRRTLSVTTGPSLAGYPDGWPDAA